MKRLNPDIGEDVLSKLQLAVPAIPLPSLTALNSAFCNDVDPSLVYAQELWDSAPLGYAACISTSGNSRKLRCRSRGRQSARTYRHRTDRREGRTTQRRQIFAFAFPKPRPLRYRSCTAGIPLSLC
ncbi:MAG: hypothetical protein ACLR56_04280 [Oscillospiraceae bacterium]